MAKLIKLYIIIPLLFIFAFVPGAVSQDWVHPNNRHKYVGYEKHKQQKQNSEMWTYATNRPLGNTRGGGTTQYRDYVPNYRPEFKFNKYTYKRPKRKGDEDTMPCNCGD